MQESLWGGVSPADEWDLDSTRSALDELFQSARQYQSSKEYLELLKFMGRFRFYSMFNALLVYQQMEGATYTATASRWLRMYRRRIKASARPLVILQPMGPVMFVFDVSQTEALEDAPPLPRDVEHPFEVRKGYIGPELDRTIANARRDGVSVATREAGSQSAGKIGKAEPGRVLTFQVRERPVPESVQVKLRYEVLLNSNHSKEARYATLAHELAHLYCGHLGTPDPRWWPDRRGLSDEVMEFEAESVCYLLCARLGIENPSDAYLAGFLKNREEVPSISLDSVMKAAGLIDQMARERLKPRKA